MSALSEKLATLEFLEGQRKMLDLQEKQILASMETDLKEMAARSMVNLVAAEPVRLTTAEIHAMADAGLTYRDRTVDSATVITSEGVAAHDASLQGKIATDVERVKAITDAIIGIGVAGATAAIGGGVNVGTLGPLVKQAIGLAEKL